MKRYYSALSLSPAVQEWIDSSRQPRVLHLFDRACNLINEQGEVLSVVSRSIGDGPFNLVIDSEVKFTKYFDLESPIFCLADQLALGNLNINITTAQLWNPRPTWAQLHTNRREIVDQCARLQVTNTSRSNSSPLPQSLISRLSTALANADLPFSVQAARRLAGLGIGLTPSGDDFIMGALYAAWMVHPSAVALSLAGEVANAAAPLTTSLSGAWLQAAGRGEAGQPWHEFFKALLASRDADPVYIQQTIVNILAVGETSGADALAGFLCTMKAWTLLHKKYG